MTHRSSGLVLAEWSDIMRDHDPNNASFEPDTDPRESLDYESLSKIEVNDSRPSYRYIDVHDRPTFVP